MNARIIIAIADSDGTTRLERKLAARGFDVERTRDGWAAMRAIVASPPAMVLIEIGDSPEGSRAFGEVLKRNPETCEVLLFAVSPKEEPRPKPAFVDGWIQAPFNADEIAAYLIRAINEKRQRPSRRAGLGDLGGELSRVGAADLLQMLCAKQSTGILHIDVKGCHGAVYMREGNIVDAEHGKTSGLKALYRILGVCEGTFGFRISDTDRPSRVSGRTDNLLMEGVKQHDELNRFLQTTASLDDVLELVPADGDEQRPLLEAQVVGLIQRFGRFADVLDHSLATDMETAKVVADLMNRGQVFTAGSGIRPRFVSPEMLGRLNQAIAAIRRSDAMGPSRLAWFVPDEQTASQLSSAFSLGIEGYNELLSTGEALQGLPANLGHLNLGQGEALDMTAFAFEAQMAPMWEPFLAPAVGIGIAAPSGRFFRQAVQARDMLVPYDLPLIFAGPENGEFEEPGMILADPCSPGGAFQIVSGLIQEIVRFPKKRGM